MTLTRNTIKVLGYYQEANLIHRDLKSLGVVHNDTFPPMQVDFLKTENPQRKTAQVFRKENLS